jgi:hypothetical protein
MTQLLRQQRSISNDYGRKTVRHISASKARRVACPIPREDIEPLLAIEKKVGLPPTFN